MTDADLIQEITDVILSGNRDTTAANLRLVLENLVSNKQNIDGLNAVSGYLGIDASNRVDVTKINSSNSATIRQVLKSDGTWKNHHSNRQIFSGTGAQVTFTVTHGGGFTPQYVTATPASVDACRVFYVGNFTLTTFDITFLVAPIVGVGNVTIHFNIE